MCNLVPLIQVLSAKRMPLQKKGNNFIPIGVPEFETYVMLLSLINSTRSPKHFRQVFT